MMSEKVQLYGYTQRNGDGAEPIITLCSASLCFASTKNMREFAALVLECAERCETELSYHDHFGDWENNRDVSVSLIENKNRVAS